MMAPIGRLIAAAQRCQRRHLVSAMSWTLVPAFLGPLMGPPLGGFIVTYLDWHWIFYINVPIGLLGLLCWCAGSFLEIPPQREAAALRSGAASCCAGVGLGSLLFGFEMIGQSADLPVPLGLIVAGQRGRHWAICGMPGATRDPLLDLSLLKIDSFRLSVIAGSLMRMTQGAQPFLLPLMFQIGFGLSAVQQRPVDPGHHAGRDR